MTNPYPSGQPYSNSPPTNSANFRRSSYASVAAGTASANHSHPHSPPARSGALSQLLRNEDWDRQRGREPSSNNNDSNYRYYNHQTSANNITNNSSGNIQSSDIAATSAMTSAKGITERGWPPMTHGDNFMGDDIFPPVTPFVWPSYLKNSRHVQRLHAEHRAAVAAVKEAHRPGKHVYYGKDNTSSGNLSASSSSVNLPKLSSTFGRSSVQDTTEPPFGSDEGLNKLPSCWSDVDKCVGLDISNDGLDVKFQGTTKTSDEAAAIRSDHPMPKEVGLFYFEVTIISRGKEGLIGIGFAGPKANLHRLPGWEPESWAYHGDDGFSFSCTSSGKQFGPKYSSLDVIGCGVNFRTSSAFFTKNGQYIGEAFENIKCDKLYPAVGMKKPGEHLQVNFGATPFVFDIDSMMENERAVVRHDINQTSVSSLESSLEERSLIQELIAQYLAHDGYVETARAFADDVHSQRESLSEHSQPLKMFDPSQDIHAVNRQKIRAAILDGNIDKALKYISTYYPHVLEKTENRDVYFKLRCRKFIEMMRRTTELQVNPNPAITSKAFGKLSEKDAMSRGDFDHQMELDEQLQRESRPPTLPPIAMSDPLDPLLSSGNPADDSMDTSLDQLKTSPKRDTSKSSTAIYHNLLTEALEYGRALKAEFSSDSRPAVKQALNDTFALIAYTDARDSIVGGLMEGKGRIEIAEEVNAAILVSLGRPSSAALEKLCAQAEVLVDMLSASGGEGAFVNVINDCLQ